MNKIPNKSYTKFGERQTAGFPRSYSGADFDIWAYYPISDALKNFDNGADGIIKFGSIQTITSSFAGSLAPVEKIGYGQPVGFTTGQKTNAGSLIFTLLDTEPLKEMYLVSSGSAMNKRATYMTVDQLPPFNIVIKGINEYLPKGINETKTAIFKMIIGVKLYIHGETISIDDFFLEQTYQYQAQHITPWIDRELSIADLTAEEDKSIKPTAFTKDSSNISDAFSDHKKLLKHAEALGIANVV